MAKKRTFFVSIIAMILLSGCGNNHGTNTRTLRNFADDIADPYFFEGNVSAAAGNLSNTQVALAEMLPTAPKQKITLSEFSTDFATNDKGRSNNIKVASKAIDETIVYPGETFSYNETVGPTTKRNGYEKATIFDRGKKAKGYGGGVCQVSSTLYNAAEKAGMEIIERHRHSLPVYYVEEGKDAATSYGVIDFKFANNKSFPVKINSWASDKKVVVGIEAV